MDELFGPQIPAHKLSYIHFFFFGLVVYTHPYIYIYVVHIHRNGPDVCSADFREIRGLLEWWFFFFFTIQTVRLFVSLLGIGVPLYVCA